jgi:two-component system C4-dicarboxylate transport sensor histidine kinase DctB
MAQSPSSNESGEAFSGGSSARPFTNGLAANSATGYASRVRSGALCHNNGGPHRLESVYVTRRLLILFALFSRARRRVRLTWSIAWQGGIDTCGATRRCASTARPTRSRARSSATNRCLICWPSIRSCRTCSPIPTARFEHAQQYLADLNTTRVPRRPTSSSRTGAAWRLATGMSPDSFVGAEYQFRPYFVDAVKGGTGRFFGSARFRASPAISSRSRYSKRVRGTLSAWRWSS